jgi:hypothetical protein
MGLVSGRRAGRYDIVLTSLRINCCTLTYADNRIPQPSSHLTRYDKYFFFKNLNTHERIYILNRPTG